MVQMKPLQRSLPITIGAGVAFAAMLAVGWIPLFGGPGYESALAAGLLLPSTTAIATALAVSTERTAPWAQFVRGVEVAVVYSVLAYATMLVHGVRVGFCDATDGTVLFVLGPFCGSLLAGAWGGICGEVAGRVHQPWRRRMAAVLLALLAPALGVLVSLWRFYASPMVFAFDPFFGFFSGTLYDTVVSDAIDRLVTYRAGSAATLLAAGAASSMFRRLDDSRLQVVPYRHPGVAWFAVVAASASIIVTAEGDRLGHWQTAESIKTALGGVAFDGRCEIVYPRFVSKPAAELMLRDCGEQAEQVRKWLDAPSPPPIRVYLFADAQQKRELMGASRTAIAKPWRNEVYLRLDSYPHPVLGHELAHVMAGAFGSGPFRIAGSYGGLVPNPGLIEGVAVAASPDDDVLTPEQWSAAMLQIGVLPRLSDVFALGFLGQNSDVSYTVAGAFVAWLRQQKGPYTIATWYSGEPIEAVANASLGMLEEQWKATLPKVELPPQAIEVARARFERPGVFGRTCPHAIDSLNARGRALAGDGDCAGACAAFSKVTALDPHDVPSRFGLAACLPRTASIDDARKAYEAIAADETLPSAQRDKAREAVADLDLMSGHATVAEKAYEQLLGRALNEDQLRTLDVKLRAARNPEETRPIVELLLGAPQRSPEPRLAYALLGKWMADAPSDGLPAYLIGRNLVSAGLWSESAAFLDWSIQRRLPEASVQREAFRLRVIVACALGDHATARKMFLRWKATPGVVGNRATVLERRLGSCVAPRGDERPEAK